MCLGKLDGKKKRDLDLGIGLGVGLELERKAGRTVNCLSPSSLDSNRGSSELLLEIHS
jgi:hypothetical protein